MVALVVLIAFVYGSQRLKHIRFPHYDAYDPIRSYGGPVEGFEEQKPKASSHEEQDVCEVHARVSDLQSNQPYHLLQDERANARHPRLSTVPTATCYQTDMEQHLSKVGNFRQLTNNYLRSGPDSCSAPWKELLFHFYETTPFHV